MLTESGRDWLHRVRGRGICGVGCWARGPGRGLGDKGRCGGLLYRVRGCIGAFNGVLYILVRHGDMAIS